VCWEVQREQALCLQGAASWPTQGPSVTDASPLLAADMLWAGQRPFYAAAQWGKAVQWQYSAVSRSTVLHLPAGGPGLRERQLPAQSPGHWPAGRKGSIDEQEGGWVFLPANAGQCWPALTASEQAGNAVGGA
jgi:hypothetical protein